MRCKLVVAEYETGRMSSSGAKPVVVSEASRGEWIPFIGSMICHKSWIGFCDSCEFLLLAL